jgi:hypothetical protein
MQLCDRGVTDNWSFKTGDYFQAEHNHIAQSGACLTEYAPLPSPRPERRHDARTLRSANCWGNPRGMAYLYFRTQNSAYETLNNNVTTPWDFRQYKAPPTHVFVNIGTNDRYWGYNGTAFENVRLSVSVRMCCR